MFDTIWMYYDSLTKTEKDYLYNISKPSTDLSEPDYYRYVGKIRLEFTQNRKTVRIRLSLPKFLNGNNIEPMTIHEVRLAIELLSEMLKIPVEKAKLTRLDIGATFGIEHPPELYQQRILSAPYLTEREQYKNTLYLKNDSRKMLFYDKLKEYLENPSATFPEAFKLYEYLLKFEVQFYDLKNQLKRDDLPCSLLYDPEFFYEMPDRYIKEFKGVKFIPTVNRNISDLSTGKQFKDFILAELLSKQPANYLDNRLKSGMEAEIFKKTGDLNRFEKDLLHLMNENSIVTTDSLKGELTQKVKSVREMFASPAIL